MAKARVKANSREISHVLWFIHALTFGDILLGTGAFFFFCFRTMSFVYLDVDYRVQPLHLLDWNSQR